MSQPSIAPVGSGAGIPCVNLGTPATGNIALLLHEVRHALAEWLDSRTEHAIDLRGIPMGPGEEDRLIEQLGRGEVQAQVTGLGRSEVIETRFHGVWLITHFDDDDAIVGRQIEITDCPWLLKSQAADASQALRELERRLPHPTSAETDTASRLENRA